MNAWTCNSLIPQRSCRRAAPVTGTLRCSHRSAAVIARSVRGSTHGGVRWNNVSLATPGCRAGTIWIADAPVPTTATRLPRVSYPWSQRAEWKTFPGNESRPGTSGTFGSDSAPVAETTTSAVTIPREVSISQCASSAIQRISRTSWSSRMCGRSPKVSATRSRYARMCRRPEKVRGQSGLGAKEKEYRCEGTSQAQPG